MEAHTSRVILHMLHLATKAYSSENEETTHVNACQSLSCCLPSKPFLHYTIPHTHFDVRWDFWAFGDDNGQLRIYFPKQV